MKNFFALAIILIVLSCNKQQQKGAKPGAPAVPLKCGIILTTPILDSFIYPTYYLTTNVAFPNGNETVHFHDNVTGDHDGSWFLPKYGKDSTFCIKP